MKLEKIKQIIKEEIDNILNEEAPKPRYKRGDIFVYRGIKYIVVSDDGYVVKAMDKDKKEAMFNYNQLNQGVFKKPDYLNEEEKEYTFKYAYWYGREDDYDFDDVTVKASSEEEARKLALEKAKEAHRRVRDSERTLFLVNK